MFEKYTADLDNVERSRDPIKGAFMMQILNALAVVAALVLTIIFCTGAIRYSFATIFDLFHTRITPADYSLIVWFVIAFLAILFLVYQVLPHQKDNLVLFRDIHSLFFVSTLVYLVWLILYTHGNFWASAAVLSLLVILLIVIYHRVKIGSKKATPPLEYLCVHLFFSVLLAWLMCLCFENWAKAARHSIDWYGEPWNQHGWAILCLCLISLFALIALLVRRDWSFGLTVAWYLIAVGANQKGWRSVLITAYVTGAVIGLLSLIALAMKIFMWLKERRKMGHGAAGAAGTGPAMVTTTTTVPGSSVGGTTVPVVTRTVVEPPVVTRTEVVDPRSDYRRDEMVVP